VNEDRVKLIMMKAIESHAVIPPSDIPLCHF